MIEEGFTEREIHEEFSWETINRYIVYKNEVAREQHRRVRSSGRGGSIGHKTQRGTIKTQPRQAF